MINLEMLNVLGWNSDDMSNLQFVAYSYIKQGKFRFAESILEALEVLDPTNLYVLQTLGACYIETKNPYKALDSLEKALKLDPTNEMNRYNRVQALISLGLRKQALEDCETLKTSKDEFIRQKAEALLLSASL